MNSRIAIVSAVGLAVIAAIVYVVFQGSLKPLNVQVVIGDREEVKQGMPIYLDDLKAGKVSSVGSEAGVRVANLAITSTVAKERMREGVYRIPKTSQVQLNSDKVADGAELVASGSRIPTEWTVLNVIQGFSRGSTIAVIAVSAIAVLLFLLFFRLFQSTVGLIIVVAVAFFLTQTVYLYLVPFVENIYERYPPPLPTQPTVVDQPAQPVPPSGFSGFVQSATDQVAQVATQRPDPRIVTWCLVFLVHFLLLNPVVGWALRSLGGGRK